MHPEQDPSPSPSPFPSPNPSSFLRDISNFKTPKTSFQNPNPNPNPLFFTASKQTAFSSTTTPSSSASALRRRRTSALPSRSKAARCLKALELEQSQSSRKAQIRRQKSVEAQSRSISVWLNFLFRNPRLCGCDAFVWNGADKSESVEGVAGRKKRESLKGGPRVGTDRAWRSPKRQRPAVDAGFSAGKAVLGFASLEASLRGVCSFEDLVERMGMYLSPDSQNEVLSVMSRVVKNIDEGRLRMKAHCPIVTDVGLKEKSTRVLMCYNLTWLRIGMHIVFGGDSLLPSEDGNSDKDGLFLNMIIEKQFFSHSDLAKSFSYNKLVEGLYRPGYFEALGSVILKRFLLLVLILDRAKCQSTLPLKYGIDGKDGGSPLLFNCKSHIKSSRQVIHEFLSKVMHGEGDLLAHLVIIGYKVLHQQTPLSEYDFSVTNLFEDLQDGVRICRAVQLLQCDSSILSKIAVPSDSRKKNLLNCGIAMQFLKQAGLPLLDEDGVSIGVEDVVNGDKELTLALLWNIFVNLQVPLLINKVLLAEEISKVKASITTSSHMEMLLEWIQAICKAFAVNVDSFASLVDGKALRYLVDYYFRNVLHVTSSLSESFDASGEHSLLHNIDNTVATYNFVLVQKVTTMLGNFPEVLQISDILENHLACNERSVIILFVFLSSVLIGRKEMDKLHIERLMGWNCCSLGARSNGNDRRLEMKPSSTSEHLLGAENGDLFNIILSPETGVLDSRTLDHDGFHEHQEECAAKVIQSHFRGSIERHSYLKMKAATLVLQAVIQAWLKATDRITTYECVRTIFQKQSPGCFKSSNIYQRYYHFMIERHTYVRIRKSVILIQRAVRKWIRQGHQWNSSNALEAKASADLLNAASIMQSYIRGRIVRSRYVLMPTKSQKIEPLYEEISAAIKIQSHWKSWCLRRDFQHQRKAIIKIQSSFRCFNVRKKFNERRQAAIEIQRFSRGYIARNKLLGHHYLHSRRLLICFPNQSRSSCVQSFQLKILLNSVLKLQLWWKRVLFLKSRIRATLLIQSHIRGWLARREAYRKLLGIVIIQSHFRGWLMRRDFLYQRKAIIKIQSSVRCFRCWKEFNQCRLATIEIQRFIRGQNTRDKLLDASSLRSKIYVVSLEGMKSTCFWNFELEILLGSVVKLQRWWRRVLYIKLKKKSVIIIQSHIRGWIARRESRQAKERIVLIQSYWRASLVRKDSREQLLDLRRRMQRSAANVDNGDRLMSRLVFALSELLSDSVSDILHTCATLAMATEHSQKCCETLVDAGAIDALLKQIRKANRSAPYQEVLKHAFSTLRNLIRYPHLAVILVNTNGSVETIFWELLRNKGEGYFVVSALLKKLCSTQEGLQAVCKLPAFLKRLNSLSEDLERKASMERRNPRLAAARGNTEHRLSEALELLQIVTNR
eukprot:TRINITY_DN8109_c0_g3_i5.p1 TRINITY_DN8109_c0_g3~~TRINITY_DN8109_c0_g3_i5.p1  ORF type:complete len:1431 (+),score=223.82 TRINITY_DN8109_c0_g3_i5:77-4294(+)